MPNVTYFVQDCPTCGRKLNIRVEYLGKRVVCQHCQGAFAAWNPEGAPQHQPASDVGGNLLDRAQELLEMADQRIAESRILKAKIEAQTAELSG